MLPPSLGAYGMVERHLLFQGGRLAARSTGQRQCSLKVVHGEGRQGSLAQLQGGEAPLRGRQQLERRRFVYSIGGRELRLRSSSHLARISSHVMPVSIRR